jgi:hypothetical protein
VLPLNVESNVAGGVAHIIERLQTFFNPLAALDVSALNRSV